MEGNKPPKPNKQNSFKSFIAEQRDLQHKKVESSTEDDVDVIILDEGSKQKQLEDEPAIRVKGIASFDALEPRNAVPESSIISKEAPASASPSSTDNQPVRRPSLTKMIANLFAPKEQKVSPMSPQNPKKAKSPRKSPKKKIQNASEHVSQSSPSLTSAVEEAVSSAVTGKSASHAWLSRDHILMKEVTGENDVSAFKKELDDPSSWSNGAQFGGDVPISNLDELSASADYQDMLDSMRLVLESNDESHHRRDKKQIGLNAIPEEKSLDMKGFISGAADVDDEDGDSDSTFEESSQSDNASDSEDDELNSEEGDWSVDDIADESRDVVAPLLDENLIRVSPLNIAIIEPAKSNPKSGKSLTHYYNQKNANRDSLSTGESLMEDFRSEKIDNSGIKHDATLYGVPISLSSTIKRDYGSVMNNPSPSVRVENLRIVLENRLGEEKFLRAYRYLRQVKDLNEFDDDQEEDKLLEDMESILGTSGLKYLELLYQLITAEENF